MLAVMLCMAAAALLAGVSYQRLGEAQKCNCSHCWAHSTGNNSSSDTQGQDDVISTRQEYLRSRITDSAYIHRLQPRPKQ